MEKLQAQNKAKKQQTILIKQAGDSAEPSYRYQRTHNHHIVYEQPVIEQRVINRARNESNGLVNLQTMIVEIKADELRINEKAESTERALVQESRDIFDVQPQVPQISNCSLQLTASEHEKTDESMQQKMLGNLESQPEMQLKSALPSCAPTPRDVVNQQQEKDNIHDESKVVETPQKSVRMTMNERIASKPPRLPPKTANQSKAPSENEGESTDGNAKHMKLLRLSDTKSSIKGNIVAPDTGRVAKRATHLDVNFGGKVDANEKSEAATARYLMDQNLGAIDSPQIISLDDAQSFQQRAQSIAIDIASASQDIPDRQVSSRQSTDNQLHEDSKRLHLNQLDQSMSVLGAAVMNTARGQVNQRLDAPSMTNDAFNEVAQSHRGAVKGHLQLVPLSSEAAVSRHVGKRIEDDALKAELSAHDVSASMLGRRVGDGLQLQSVDDSELNSHQGRQVATAFNPEVNLLDISNSVMAAPVTGAFISAQPIKVVDFSLAEKDPQEEKELVTGRDRQARGALKEQKSKRADEKTLRAAVQIETEMKDIELVASSVNPHELDSMASHDVEDLLQNFREKEVKETLKRQQMDDRQRHIGQEQLQAQSKLNVKLVRLHKIVYEPVQAPSEVTHRARDHAAGVNSVCAESAFDITQMGPQVNAPLDVDDVVAASMTMIGGTPRNKPYKAAVEEQSVNWSEAMYELCHEEDQIMCCEAFFEDMTKRAALVARDVAEQRAIQERDEEKRRIADAMQLEKEQERTVSKQSATSYVQRLILGVSTKVHILDMLNEEKRRMDQEKERLLEAIHQKQLEEKRKEEARRLEQQMHEEQQQIQRQNKVSSQKYMQRLMLGVVVKVHLADEVKQEKERVATQTRKAKEQALQQLQEYHDRQRREAQEAEQRRLEEQERLRQEQEEAERKRLEEEEAEKKRIEEERLRLEAEELERQRAEKARLEAERQAEIDRENQRKEQERQEILRRQEEVDRRAREAQARLEESAELLRRQQEEIVRANQLLLAEQERFREQQEAFRAHMKQTEQMRAEIEARVAEEEARRLAEQAKRNALSLPYVPSGVYGIIRKQKEIEVNFQIPEPQIQYAHDNRDFKITKINMSYLHQSPAHLSPANTMLEQMNAEKMVNEDLEEEKAMDLNNGLLIFNEVAEEEKLTLDDAVVVDEVMPDEEAQVALQASDLLKRKKRKKKILLPPQTVPRIAKKKTKKEFIKVEEQLDLDLNEDTDTQQLLLAVSPKVDGFEPDLLDENVQLTGQTNMLDSELGFHGLNPENQTPSAQPSQRDMKQKRRRATGMKKAYAELQYKRNIETRRALSEQRFLVMAAQAQAQAQAACNAVNQLQMGMLQSQHNLPHIVNPETDDASLIYVGADIQSRDQMSLAEAQQLQRKLDRQVQLQENKLSQMMQIQSRQQESIRALNGKFIYVQRRGASNHMRSPELARRNSVEAATHSAQKPALAPVTCWTPGVMQSPVDVRRKKASSLTGTNFRIRTASREGNAATLRAASAQSLAAQATLNSIQTTNLMGTGEVSRLAQTGHLMSSGIGNGYNTYGKVLNPHQQTTPTGYYPQLVKSKTLGAVAPLPRQRLVMKKVRTNAGRVSAGSADKRNDQMQIPTTIAAMTQEGQTVRVPSKVYERVASKNLTKTLSAPLFLDGPYYQQAPVVQHYTPVGAWTMPGQAGLVEQVPALPRAPVSKKPTKFVKISELKLRAKHYQEREDVNEPRTTSDEPILASRPTKIKVQKMK